MSSGPERKACPWTTLGVPRSATAAEIEAAYRALALKFHPDVNSDCPHASARFRAVAGAMQELRDLEAGSTVGRPPAGGWRGGWRPRTETSERYAEPKVRYGEPYAHRASRRAAKQPSPVARAVGLAAAVVVAAAAVRAAADERARQNALGEWRRREEERGKMRAEKPLHGKHRRRDKVRKRKGGTPDSEGG